MGLDKQIKRALNRNDTDERTRLGAKRHDGGETNIRGHSDRGHSRRDWANMDGLGCVLSVNVGQPRLRYRTSSKVGELDGPVYQTAIEKKAVAGGVFVSRTNLWGDGQADWRHHGGLDKAVHAHFLGHLQRFSDLTGWSIPPGYLGENLTLASTVADGPLTEQDFCLGDIVDVGTATLQVSQPRIPCFKQADQLKVVDLLAIVVREGRTGLYFRVMKEGVLAAGDVLRLRERPYPQWTIDRLNQLIRFPKDPNAWKELAQYPKRAIELRRRAEEWERS